jgi:hypothetical protein
LTETRDRKRNDPEVQEARLRLTDIGNTILMIADSAEPKDVLAANRRLHEPRLPPALKTAFDMD